jgi:GMP reductase
MLCKSISGGVAAYRAPEGKKVYVKASGPADATIRQILGGVRSACTYVGAERLKDLPKCTTFVRVNRQLNNIFT